MIINWVHRNDRMPTSRSRVITYSACHDVDGGDPGMVFRTMDGMSVRRSTDVSHWAYLEAPIERREKP